MCLVLFLMLPTVHELHLHQPLAAGQMLPTRSFVYQLAHNYSLISRSRLFNTGLCKLCSLTILHNMYAPKLH